MNTRIPGRLQLSIQPAENDKATHEQKGIAIVTATCLAVSINWGSFERFL